MICSACLIRAVRFILLRIADFAVIKNWLAIRHELTVEVESNFLTDVAILSMFVEVKYGECIYCGVHIYIYIYSKLIIFFQTS